MGATGWITMMPYSTRSRRRSVRRNVVPDEGVADEAMGLEGLHVSSICPEGKARAAGRSFTLTGLAT